MIEIIVSIHILYILLTMYYLLKLHKDTEATCTVTHALQNFILYSLIHTLQEVDKVSPFEKPCISVFINLQLCLAQKLDKHWICQRNYTATATLSYYPETSDHLSNHLTQNKRPTDSCITLVGAQQSNVLTDGLG